MFVPMEIYVSIEKTPPGALVKLFALVCDCLALTRRRLGVI